MIWNVFLFMVTLGALAASCYYGYKRVWLGAWSWLAFAWIVIIYIVRGR